MYVNLKVSVVIFFYDLFAVNPISDNYAELHLWEAFLLRLTTR